MGPEVSPNGRCWACDPAARTFRSGVAEGPSETPEVNPIPADPPPPTSPVVSAHEPAPAYAPVEGNGGHRPAVGSTAERETSRCPDPRDPAIIRVSCDVCGRRFVPTSRTGGNDRYCDDRCKRRARDARRRARNRQDRLKSPSISAQNRSLAVFPQVHSRQDERLRTPPKMAVSETISLSGAPDGGVSKGTSQVVDSPRARGKLGKRTLQVRVSEEAYLWTWRMAFLRRESVGEVVDRALRIVIRKLITEWPIEYVADLPRLGRSRRRTQR
jgi:hypothetical protein